MALLHFAIFLLILSHILSISAIPTSYENQPPKLLLISFDGLRYDFITANRTPTLWSLSRRGVSLDRGIKVQVHTVTAPNHYTIVTGLYQESHGIIDNKFWDPNLKEMYDLWNYTMNSTVYERSKMASWYTGTTPIWQINEDKKYSQGYIEKNGRRSGSLNWPMGDCFINNKTIFKNETWLDYNNISIWRQEMDTLLDWMTDPKEPTNFVLYYNAQPDASEHYSNLFGANVTKTLKDIDSVVAYLIEKLKMVSMWDKVNLIITSDHGFATVPDKQHFILLEDYLDKSRIIINSRTIFPKPGSGVTVEEIYQNLTRAKIENNYPMRIWRKEEFPVQYHFANNSRIGPIIVYEDLNYLIFFGSPENYTRDHIPPVGTHGWLNDYTEMRAFFMAYGPAFKNGLQANGRDEIENVDLYPLMCKILGLEPKPNNGSLERIKFILKDEDGGG